MRLSPRILLRRVKVCGLTRVQDVRQCSRLGADFLGFVLTPSPRQISLDTLRALVAEVPASILTVAVTVNPAREEVDELLEVVDRVQFHGQESPEFCRRYRKRAIKAFRVRDRATLDTVEAYHDAVGALLLDSYRQGVAGGTGHAFGWDLLRHHTFALPTFLAGGVEVGNLAEAWKVETVSGFDLSSGLENSPGIKDAHKIDQFFALLGQLRGNDKCRL